MLKLKYFKTVLFLMIPLLGIPSSGCENIWECRLLFSMFLVSVSVSLIPVRLKSSSTGAPCSNETPMVRSAESGHPSTSAITEACRPTTGSRRHSSKLVDTGLGVTPLDAAMVRLLQPSLRLCNTVAFSVMLWRVIPVFTAEFAIWLPQWCTV